MYIASNIAAVIQGKYDWSCGLNLETLSTEGFCEESSSKQLPEIPSVKWKSNIKADLRKMNCDVSSYIQLFYMCPELVQFLSSGRF